MIDLDHIYNEDCLEGLRQLPDNCIDCCVTSPPYYLLRDYNADGQIGLEDTPEQYIDNLTNVFEEVRRVMKPSGTLWVVIGDSYAGSGKGSAKYADNAMNYKQGTNRGMLGRSAVAKKMGGDYKPKDLIGIPWMLAFALRQKGWYLRQDIIWHKTNCMVESVRDRCTKSHEYIFLLSKSKRYYYDAASISEPVAQSTKIRAQNTVHPARYGGNKYTATPDKFYRTKSGNAYQYRSKRNKRDVWTTSTAKSREAHFATFPEKLIIPCILAGCPQGGCVLDPFMGTGTTGIVAARLNRHFIGFEINEEYCKIASLKTEKELAQMKLF